MGLQDEVEVGSDPSGARWLYSSNPRSRAWSVFLIGGRDGDHAVRVGAPRTKDEVLIVGLRSAPASVWPACAEHCHVEVVDESGISHELGACLPASEFALGDAWIVDRSCARCGEPAVWLVASVYEPGSVAGRLMTYCDGCRAERAAGLGLVVPLSMFVLDPSALLSLMYRGAATRTVPGAVAEDLGVPDGRWVQVAKEVLARDGGPS